MPAVILNAKLREMLDSLKDYYGINGDPDMIRWLIMTRARELELVYDLEELEKQSGGWAERN